MHKHEWTGSHQSLLADGAPLRGIAEPVWAGRRPAEIAECQIHEALLNVAVPADVPLWLLCPYDADALPAEVIDEAQRSHPGVVHADGRVGDLAYAGHEHGRRLLETPLPEPTTPTEVLHFGRGELTRVRTLVERRATAAGLGRDRVGDLVLAVNEVAANSLDHGGGAGFLRAWTEPGALVLEVLDAGRIVDPLVGRINPSPHQARGRGLWMVNTLCDLLQIRSTDRGTATRVVTWLPPARQDG
jgi:anti-sigma regulatory factor (Ser/Thr protein kinase)